MIGPAEVAAQASRWGVAAGQIEKDHVISHLLATIAEVELPTWFYGGTALNRSHIRMGRLSEDIDLMVEDPTIDIEGILRRPLLRHLGATSWELRSRLRWMRTYQVAALGTSVKFQLVRFDRDDRRWGWEEREVELRYSCLPAHTVLRLPEVEAFVAMKLSAYTDRFAGRDLMDLYQLSRRGAITPAAIARFREVTGRGVSLYDFKKMRGSGQAEWVNELGHQMSDPGSADVALRSVHDALGTALGADSG